MLLLPSLIRKKKFCAESSIHAIGAIVGVVTFDGVALGAEEDSLDGSVDLVVDGSALGTRLGLTLGSSVTGGGWLLGSGDWVGA